MMSVVFFLNENLFRYCSKSTLRKRNPIQFEACSMLAGFIQNVNAAKTTLRKRNSILI